MLFFYTLYVVSVLINLTAVVLATELNVDSNIVASTLSSQEIRYFDIDVTFTEPIITQSNGDTTISIDNTTLISEPTYPMLPQRLVSLYIPEGYEVSSVQVLAETSSALGTNHIIPPAPYPDSPLDHKPTVRNESIYLSDEPFPRSIVRTYGARDIYGYDIFQIAVFPITYYPFNGTLFFHRRMTVRINVQGMSSESVGESEEERGFIGSIVDNDEALSGAFESSVSVVSADSPRPTGTQTFEYIIVYKSPDFDAAANKIGIWKYQKGYTVGLASLSYFQSNFDGYDLAEKIRNGLKYLHDNYGTKWVLREGELSTSALLKRPTSG